MKAVAFLGFGELGSSLGGALTAAGGYRVTGWSRPPRDERSAQNLERRLTQADTTRADSLEEAVDGADAVLVVAPAEASEEIVRKATPRLTTGSLYVDLSAAPPASKVLASELVEARGARFADVAVLGTVAASGHAVPLAASGDGAEAFRELVDPAGLVVTSLRAPAGHASLLKLLRSVYMKGRDALVLEMMLAARSYGLEDEIVDTIAGPGEEVPFRALSERIVTALAVHAERRAGELHAAEDVLRQAGVAPLLTEAGVERLERMAQVDLRRRFGGERPASAAEVLDALKADSGGAPDG